MRTNNNQETPVTIDGRHVDDVEEFVYLGSKISKSGGTEEDIRARINRARYAFTVLRPMWKNSAISNATKIRILNSNVKAVLLYGAETWRVSKTSTEKLQTFMNKCLRHVLKLRWQEKVPNIELWKRTRQEPMAVQIRRRKWRWVGHTLRKAHSNVTRQALEWNPQGKRKRGRPRQTWRRSLLEELKTAGKSWEAAKSIAGDRTKWKVMVEALCSTRSKDVKVKSIIGCVVSNYIEACVGSWWSKCSLYIVSCRCNCKFALHSACKIQIHLYKESSLDLTIHWANEVAFICFLTSVLRAGCGQHFAQPSLLSLT